MLIERKEMLNKLEKFSLSSQMKKIFSDYKQMGLYPYEIYTLMLGFAEVKNYPYSIQSHNELLKTINQ